ncbi:MAG: ribonuclease R [Deltaproteobacteria bacterium]|nr:ribonuclease R [Deltaproteobacteria bacterium]
MPVTLSPESVLAVLEDAGGRPLKAKDVSRALGLGADDRSEVRDALRALVDEGKAQQLEGRRFVVAGATAGKGSAKSGVAGVVQRKASGVGWFIPDDKSVKDGFLAPQELKTVVDGDRVLARIEKGHRGAVAVVVEVLSHARTTITGTLRTSNEKQRVGRHGSQAFLEVDDNVLTGPVRISDVGSKGDLAKDGDVVEVEILEYPTASNPALGRVIRRIGEKGALDVEIERLIVSAGVIRAFPPEAVRQAESHGEDPDDDAIRQEVLKGRLDLRHLPIVTIDGETAKDFDDAVYAAPGKRKGTWDVVVCVADVSHYVTLNSPLDEEARRRATSIYYPGRVVPMLPEALSNGLCSLKPNVPRLCAIVQFVVDSNGGVTNEEFAFGVMQSRARLTYSLVQRFLDEDAGKPEPYPVPPQPKDAVASTARLTEEVKTSLRHLADAARSLRAARSARGALDFELPEVVIDLDVRKEPLGLRHLERAFSHRLIEDLMIAANEAAARFFDGQNFPSVYRIHEVPDDEKLERFLNLARPTLLATGQKLPKSILDDAGSSQGLMAVLNALGDHPSRSALDMLLLRSMKQARYSVDNVGHYGLGSEAYLHFTSPIRRYPDLIVHRLLRQRLSKSAGKKKKAEGDDDGLIAELEDIAATSSERERKASDLERAVSQLYACWLMKDRIGEVHPGVVTGVSEAGAFVRLEDLFVEGLVRMQDLGNEYFSFDEEALTLRGDRSRDMISFGVRFEVELLAVDLTRRQMSFLRAGPLIKPQHPDGASSSSSPSSSSGSKPVSGWEPRTDARPQTRRQEPRSGGRSPSRGAPAGSGKQPAAKRGRRQERANERVEAAKPAPVEANDPRGRGRGEKQRAKIFEAALRHLEEGTATPEERILVEERTAQLDREVLAKAAAAQKGDERRARTNVKKEREERTEERQLRYEEQQQIAKIRPEIPEAPLKLSGPEALRALFETRGGGPKKGAKKAKKKTSPSSSSSRKPRPR